MPKSGFLFFSIEYATPQKIIPVRETKTNMGVGRANYHMKARKKATTRGAPQENSSEHTRKVFFSVGNSLFNSKQMFPPILNKEPIKHLREVTGKKSCPQLQREKGSFFNYIRDKKHNLTHTNLPYQTK